MAGLSLHDGPNNLSAADLLAVMGDDLSSTFVAQQSRDVARRYGFAVNAVDRGHWFLAFAPNGDMVASLVRSNGGRTLGKSSDNGKTWTTLGTPSTSNSPAGLWFTQAGTWLCYASGALFRSTDGGMTWASVATTGTILNQGVTQETNGTLWAIEYLGDARVFRSTDDGLTWTEVYNWPNVDNGSGTVIRHAHGIAALPSGVWAFTGDNNTQCGLWRWEGGTFVRKSPAITDAQGAQRYRAVGLTERNGWLYWVQDGASAAGAQPAIVKANPSDIAGTLTVLADVPTGGWYIKALPSGDLVVGSVNEGIGKELDRNARLWLIDSADHVSEAWSAAPAPSGLTGDFIAVRALDVRASDGLVAFTVNQTDFTGPGSTAYATVQGYMKVTADRPAVMSRQSTPSAYADMARAWTATGTTSSPNTTSGSYVDIPEMALPVNVRSLRPILVTLSMDCYNNTAGQYTNVRLIAYDNITGGATNISPTQSYGAQVYGPMTVTGMFVPTLPGDYTIKAQWSTSGGSRGESRFTYRQLSAAEL